MASEQPPAKVRKLVGFDNFVRHNPKSDRFEVIGFHHVEYWCADATNTARRFSCGLGMRMVGRSDVQTGNFLYTSYVLECNELTFAFTAPYWTVASPPAQQHAKTFEDFDRHRAIDFIAKHGLAVRAIGLRVADAAKAYEISCANGARAAHAPVTVTDENGSATFSEVEIYGDVVLRYVSYTNYTGPMLPGYQKAEPREPINYGLTRIDHIVGNVPVLLDVVEYVQRFTGFHEFAEFIASDVGTVDSGLNSMVLGNNNELVLLPVNEPTFGTPRKSQIQTYLEHNQGPGVQHIALKTDDIFYTLKRMRENSPFGGLEFMPRPSDKYYHDLPGRIGDSLTDEQYKTAKEYGVLVDKDDQGVLLQIFTRPLLDRPTLFIEIIQRVGCMDDQGHQAGGCGGFGKGNFSELFKSIEDFERTMEGERPAGNPYP